jgi:hypothetical protein
MHLFAFDEDGDPRRFEIDWGDGSPVELVDVHDGECHVFPSGWSDVSARTVVPHRYRSSPRPDFHVTAVSTGCDGTEPQRGVLHPATETGG